MERNRNYMIKEYKVGRWAYQIQFAEGNAKNGQHLLPSSAPFEVSVDDEPLIFRLVVDDSFRPARRGEEIGQFDCGGSNHGVYRSPEGTYQFQISDVLGRQCSLLEASPDFSEGHVALNGNTNMRVYGLNNALMMMYAFSTADRATLLMHASVVRENGKGYPFLGVSGTGKSTHTANWLKYVPDTDLMNDDNPVVRVIDGRPVVFGSPWSGKTPCYRNVEAPVGAFVQLEQAPFNAMRRQSVVEAFASLLTSCSVMKWDERVYLGICSSVGSIIESTPTYLLENLPDEVAVRLSYATVTGNTLP